MRRNRQFSRANTMTVTFLKPMINITVLFRGMPSLIVVVYLLFYQQTSHSAALPTFQKVIVSPSRMSLPFISRDKLKVLSPVQTNPITVPSASRELKKKKVWSLFGRVLKSLEAQCELSGFCWNWPMCKMNKRLIYCVNKVARFVFLMALRRLV